MSIPRRARQTTARRTLLVLTMVFVLPLVIAWVLTIGPLEWRPTNTVNHGLLLEPPLHLSSYGVLDRDRPSLTGDAAAGDWFLVVLGGAACGEPCQGLLRIAERIRIAVGRDMYRVKVALLSPGQGRPGPRRRSWLLPADGRLISALHRASGGPQLDTMLLIVDHRGRAALMYPASEDGQGALEDLKRLLRTSPRR